MWTPRSWDFHAAFCTKSATLGCTHAKEQAGLGQWPRSVYTFINQAATAPAEQAQLNMVNHLPCCCLLMACLCSCCSCSCPSSCCCRPAAGASHAAVGAPRTARAVGGAPRQGDPPQGSVSICLCGSSQQWAVVLGPAEPGVEGVLRGCSRGDRGAPGCYSRGGRNGGVAVDVAGGCSTRGWGAWERDSSGRRGYGHSR